MVNRNMNEAKKAPEDEMIVAELIAAASEQSSNHQWQWNIGAVFNIAMEDP